MITRASPATAATAKLIMAARRTDPRLGQARADQPQRAHPHPVGATDPVGVVVGVVHSDLQREADHQGQQRRQPGRRRRRRRPGRRPRPPESAPRAAYAGARRPATERRSVAAPPRSRRAPLGDDHRPDRPAGPACRWAAGAAWAARPGPGVRRSAGRVRRTSCCRSASSPAPSVTATTAVPHAGSGTPIATTSRSAPAQVRLSRSTSARSTCETAADDHVVRPAQDLQPPVRASGRDRRCAAGRRPRLSAVSSGCSR